MGKALLVNLEGPDGVGKTTHSIMLKDALAEKGIEAVIDHEPTSGDFGRMIKIILNKQTTAQDFIVETQKWFRRSMESCFTESIVVNHYYDELRIRADGILRLLEAGKRLTGLDMQFLFFLDRFFDIRDAINPSLEKGVWVIADRYSLSSGAYGFGQHDIPVAETFALESKVLSGIYRYPDVKIYLDLPATKCLERLKKAGREVDIFETLYGLEKTTQGYKQAIALKEDEGGMTFIVDADQSIDVVFQSVLACVRKVFKFNFETAPI